MENTKVRINCSLSWKDGQKAVKIRGPCGLVLRSLFTFYNLYAFCKPFYCHFSNSLVLFINSFVFFFAKVYLRGEKITEIHSTRVGTEGKVGREVFLLSSCAHRERESTPNSVAPHLMSLGKGVVTIGKNVSSPRWEEHNLEKGSFVWQVGRLCYIGWEGMASNSRVYANYLPVPSHSLLRFLIPIPKGC